MKKLKKKMLIVSIVFFMIMLLANQLVFANNSANLIKERECTKEYERWLQLSEEEKKHVMQPRKYEVEFIKTKVKNPFLKAQMVRASALSRYNLKEVIPANVQIRNQQQTNECWAFAILSSLETNLALKNKKNGINTERVYDFSERHMDYATSNVFTDTQNYEKGYVRERQNGGNYYFALSYLTNGSGAINESDMKFENNQDLINISEIDNKTVVSQIYDTIEFPNYNKKSDTEKVEIMEQIKTHIRNYGAVYGQIHGNTSQLKGLNCYNNDTGAIYCNNSFLYGPNHAVSIIGWNDNYPREKFAEDLRPENAGAWIIRNSWGERQEYNLIDLKTEIFNSNQGECISKDWTEPSLIPNEIIEQAGFTIEGDIAYMKVGDNGLMYVSYEDCNIASALFGIVKASDCIEYDNIYQYDEFFPAHQIACPSQNIMLRNIFDKKTTGKEYLTQVSLYAPKTYTCKVYVNPKGIGATKPDLQSVPLKSGETETISVGYHTLEFDNPIEIKGDKFTVVIEIQSVNSLSSSVALEANLSDEVVLGNVKTVTEKCFVAAGNDLDNCEWIDLGQENEDFIKGDSTIKAFTTITPPTGTPESNDTPPDETQPDQTPPDETQPDETQPDETQLDQTPPDETSPDDTDKAINSDLTNIKCFVESFTVNIDTEQQDKISVLMDIIINDIDRNLNNDSLEYYYYLSNDATEENINDWVKITEEQKSENQLKFKIDTKDISNYNEISANDSLYLYIKEVAKKGSDQSIAISKSMKLEVETEPEIYAGDNPPDNPNQQGIGNTEDEDKTISTKFLPNTGIKIVIPVIMFIVIIGLISLMGYKKYRNIK